VAKNSPAPIASDPLRLLIIGGSGFVSGALTRLALARGHAVTIITRGQRPVPAGVAVITADRQDRTNFAHQLSEHDATWDLVVDAIPYTPDDAQQDVAVFSGRAAQLVFVSTDFVYDPRHRKNPQTEHDATYSTGGYGGLKRQAELILEQTPTTSLAWTILRPSHIYGPGSLPGCLPLHGRDPQLLDHLRQRRPLRLVNGGSYLQHPVLVDDLAAAILSAARNPSAIGKTCNVAGPDILASHAYYRLLGRLLDRDVTIEDVPVAEFLAANPDKAPFCCDRVYDLTALRAAQLTLPATTLEAGLRQQLNTLQS